MSMPEETAMRNTVRSPVLPQNMLLSSTFIVFVVDVNGHLQANEFSPATHGKSVSVSRTKQ
jgi:hypothetical protein